MSPTKNDLALNSLNRGNFKDREFCNSFYSFRKWRTDNLSEKDGIVVGSDITQEWLLPWWWEHYSRHNSYPVAFVDFGMSEEMKTWCKERGEWIFLGLADIFVAERQEIDPALAEKMEGTHGKVIWTSRNAWFKKPLACLQSPFRRSVWIDLDCQIFGSIAKLFELCEPSLAMARELPPFHSVKANYNSGVIAFKHGISAIKTWADQSFTHNHEFTGDQDILYTLIHEQKLDITEIPTIYNWSRSYPENKEAIILHWQGPQGKSAIIHQIMRKHLEFF